MTQPTQIEHPWRATIRTLFAAVVALASLLPYILGAAHVDATVWGAQALVVASAVTRVMALPGVNAWLERFGLGATSSTKESQ